LEEQIITKNRILVGNLIKQVLLGKIKPSFACGKFPKERDLSIESAFYALVHLEADEDLRKNVNYKNEQDDYLLYIAQILEKGEALPKNIIAQYSKYYEEAPIYPEITKENIIKRINKFINL